jgi:para-nitrobenzyl esterase
MVWFHGGAFSYGPANTPRTAGANLARRADVVVVTVNHRLNVLGFLGFGPVVDGSDLPHHPFDPTATDISDDVPVMVGGTKDENAIFLAPDDLVWNRTLSEDQLKARVAELTARDTDVVIALYRRMHPA